MSTTTMLNRLHLLPKKKHVREILGFEIALLTVATVVVVAL